LPAYAKETALHKAIEVAQRRFGEDGQLADLVIAADTVVDIGGAVLEKPDGADGAAAMLARLSGCKHAVHTGVALVMPRAVGACALGAPPAWLRHHLRCTALTTLSRSAAVPDPALGVSPRVISFSETTQVEFASLSPELIRAYIATGEPFGKAGAYGIQGVGGSFVKGINGCYYNVMGLPLHRFAAEVVSLLESNAL
jgi:septum formation protein